DRLELVVVAIHVVLFAESSGRPQLRLARRKAELGRHDTDHRVRLVVEQKLSAEHAWIAAKLRLPEAVAQERRAGGALAIVAVDEETADERLHAKCRKEVGGHRGARDVEWLARTQQVRGKRMIHTDAVEHGARLCPVAIVR